MPERTGRARVLGLLATGAFAALLAAPIAAAQTVPPPSSTPEPAQPTPTQPTPTQPTPPSESPEQEPPGSWGASSFDAPFDQPGATLRGIPFDVSGTLRYQRTGPTDFIREVEVRIVDDPSDSSSLPDGCPLPEPMTLRQDGPSGGMAAEHAFLVEGVMLPCNGRYLVQAEGRLADPDAPPHTLEQSFVLEVLPPPVTGLGVTVDGASRSAKATFQPLDTELPFDATGYVLERSGSEDGAFVDVATIPASGEPALVDPLRNAPAGTYTYRVRAVRGGADGDVRSSVDDTETATVEITGGPKSSGGSATGRRVTRSSGRRSSGGRVTSSGSGARPTTSTTLDTGFEDTLDYGDEPGSEEAADVEPLAGQSIVQDEGEGEGMGLAVPAAGALVMLGWSGHILYLNRLARQL